MRLLLPLLAALALAACGSSSEAPSGSNAPSAPPAAATGPGITIEEALAANNTTEPLLVRGALIAENGTVRLCSAVLESYPPQCGRPALVVEGLDLAALEGLTTAAGVTWSDDEVKLLGSVADGSLTVSGTSSA